MSKQFNLPCYFCNSTEHSLQFCDSYNSSEPQNFHLKKFCKSCFSSLRYSSNRCKECDLFFKCHICFSKQHNTGVCPEKASASKWHFPKINCNLNSRYIRILDPMEQYFLSTSAPLNVVNSFPLLKQLSITVVSDEDIYKFPRTFQQVVSSTIVIVKHARIETAQFFKLLSPATKLLECSNVTFTTKISFATILINVVNVEEIKFMDSEIEMSNSHHKMFNMYGIEVYGGKHLGHLDWVNILEVYGKKLKQLQISLDAFEYNFAKLANIIKQRNIQIFIFLKLDSNYSESCNLINQKLSSHFVPISSNEKISGSKLIINIFNNKSDIAYICLNHFRPI